MVRGTSIVFVLTQRKDGHPATGGAEAILLASFRANGLHGRAIHDGAETGDKLTRIQG
jgi:hypothetical protein